MRFHRFGPTILHLQIEWLGTLQTMHNLIRLMQTYNKNNPEALRFKEDERLRTNFLRAD